MAKPSGALDITSDTVDPLSIDLEEWNTYIVEGTSNVAPLYMYTCSRVPMVPGELQTDGNLSAARLELGISSTGLADEQAVFRTKVFRDRNGTSNTPLGGATLEAGGADPWIHCYRNNNWIMSPPEIGALHGPIEISGVHGNIALSQGAWNWIGIWCHWKSDVQEPVACDRVDTHMGTKTVDDTCSPNNFASAYHAMSGFALTLNTFALMNSGGFGTGVFAVPMFGYPVPMS
jgi:hypothetical protein